MNSHLEQQFADFESLLDRWAEGYQSAVVSYVALKTANGLRLLFGRVLLELARYGADATAFSFETEHLTAARYVSVATPDKIRSLLVKARSGQISSADNATTVSFQTDASLSIFFSPIRHPFVSEGPRLPSLRISGPSKHGLIASVVDSQVLDWELKAADTPYDNLDELLNQCGLPTQMQMGDSTTLEIVARSPVVIASTSAIAGTNALIECHLAATLAIEKLRLGYKVVRKGDAQRESVSGSALDWRRDGDVKIGAYRVPVGEASLLQAFVSYAGVAHHQWWVTDPQKRLNPRHAIHQVFDDDLELLRRMLLKPSTDNPQAFENALSTLLNLLGFSASNYGRIPKLQKGPDIIAISPAGHIGVVECTVGLLDQNDKLAKLVQRAKLIRDKLNSSGYRFLQLQAVIVTPLSRDEVTANLEAAGKHDIAVLCREDIEELLNQVNLPPNADRLFEDAKRLVPNSSQTSLFRDNM
jgi:hypothetical protein